MSVNKLNNIFREECSYDNINNIRDTDMRNPKNGIKLADAFLYKFLYAKKNTVKEAITAEINKKYNNINKKNNQPKNFKRQAFDQKEANIPVQIYQTILDRLVDYCGTNYTDCVDQS